MGGGGGGGDVRMLDLTPTWAVAAVCAVIVIISILLEKLIHKFAKVFEEKKKHALLEALEKIKAELMVLGFISLLLTFGQNYISKVCIPQKYGNTMLPCLPVNQRVGEHPGPSLEPKTNDHDPPSTEHEPPPGEHEPPATEDEPTPTEHEPTPKEPAADEGGGKGEHEPTPKEPAADEGGGKGEHEPTPKEPAADEGGGKGEHEPTPKEPAADEGGGKGEHEPTPKEPAADEGGGKGEDEPTPKKAADEGEPKGEHHRRLLSYERRILSGGGGGVGCKPGYIPLISVSGLHQLHIFIFFLAVFHVIYSAITMTLGRAKIRGWKEWEQDHVVDEDALNDPRRFRLTHETSFVRDHNSIWTKTPVSFYFVCFFRQFFRSVRRADYLTMRHGFVSVHLAPGSKFDFQKYIKRSLEDDFKVVVGISPILWGSVVLFLLVNVHGWHAAFWVSFLPLVVILAVGTKLQAIITRMALDIKERHAVVQGIPLVQVSDKYFWFEWPQLVLYLLHYVLFQNAFELTFFWWTWYEFGWASCFYEDDSLMIVRVALGLGAQFVCSYITLPLYALVTQMGSTMKRSIFDEQTSKALKNWRKHAMHKKPSKKHATVETRTLGSGGSPIESPMHTQLDDVNLESAETEMQEQGTATIVTSVDRNDNFDNRDLLTGP